jgi:hypothetical protein
MNRIAFGPLGVLQANIGMYLFSQDVQLSIVFNHSTVLSGERTSRYRHDHVYFAILCVTLIRVLRALYVRGPPALSPTTCLFFWPSRRRITMTELEPTSFEEPALLLEDPSESDLLHLETHRADGGEGFTSNGLLGGGVSSFDEDAHMDDVTRDNVDGLGGSFGGERE